MELAFKNIIRKRTRSFLTILGIIIGVLSITIIGVISDIGKYTLNSELNSMGIAGLMISKSDITSSFSNKDLATVLQNKDVQYATPVMSSLTNISIKGTKSEAIIWGIDSNTHNIVSLKLLHGRLINDSDITLRNRVCIVDESFAKLNYFRSNIVGKTIKIQNNNTLGDFKIIGVVQSGGNILNSMMGNIVPSFLYAPFTTLTGNFNQILIKLNQDADEKIVAEKLANHTTHVENLNSQKDKLNSILNIVTTILSVIGGISLLVSGLSIMTVMIMTVNERTYEIGIKKSIGATKLNILLEFLTEASLISAFGGIIGGTLGIIVGIILCSIVSVPIVFSFTYILYCMLFTVIIGVLFGSYPALKAANLKPIDALSSR